MFQYGNDFEVIPFENAFYYSCVSEIVFDELTEVVYHVIYVSADALLESQLLASSQAQEMSRMRSLLQYVSQTTQLLSRSPQLVSAFDSPIDTRLSSVLAEINARYPAQPGELLRFEDLQPIAAPVVKEATEIRSAAAAAGGLLGFVLGGPIGGIASAAVANYVAVKDNEGGDVVRRIGRALLGTSSFLGDIDRRYNVSTNVVEAIPAAKLLSEIKGAGEYGGSSLSTHSELADRNLDGIDGNVKEYYYKSLRAGGDRNDVELFVENKDNYYSDFADVVGNYSDYADADADVGGDHADWGAAQRDRPLGAEYARLAVAQIREQRKERLLKRLNKAVEAVEAIDVVKVAERGADFTDAILQEVEVFNKKVFLMLVSKVGRIDVECLSVGGL